MTIVDRILDDLAGHVPANRSESIIRDQFLALARQGMCSVDRQSFIPGHITCSAFAVDSASGNVLLIFHGKLKSWFQPGGHVETDDQSPANAAVRELREETGAKPRSEPVLFDLDIHTIPARGSELEHLHYDMRYLVEVDQRIPSSQGEEKSRWYSGSALIGLDTDNSVRRMYARWNELLTEVGSKGKQS